MKILAMKGGRIAKQVVFSRRMAIKWESQTSPRESLFIQSVFTGLTTPVNIKTYWLLWMDTLLLQCINPSRFHLQLFQTLDEKRIDHTRDNLWKCTNLESRICVEQDEVGFLLPSSLSKRTKRFSSSLVDIRDLLFNYTEASMSQYNFFGKKKLKAT